LGEKRSFLVWKKKVGGLMKKEGSWGFLEKERLRGELFDGGKKKREVLNTRGTYI